MHYAEYFTLDFYQWIQFLLLLNDLKRLTFLDGKVVASDNDYAIDYYRDFMEENQEYHQSLNSENGNLYRFKFPNKRYNLGRSALWGLWFIN